MKPLKLLLPSAILGIALAAAFGQGNDRPQSEFEIGEQKKGKIRAALPEKTPAPFKKKHEVLVFSNTTGFRHSSIPVGVEAMKQLGQKTGLFNVTHSEAPSAFEADSLAKFDAVIMMNTTGEPLRDKVEEKGVPREVFEANMAEARKAEERRKAAFAEFVKSGKGLIGMHSATDTYANWKDYVEMMGGSFESHPWGSGDKVRVRLVDPGHPLNASFAGKPFDIQDEIYKFQPTTASPEGRRMLLALDPEGTDMKKDLKDGKPARDFYPIAWLSKFGAGRTFYCSLGHNDHVYWTTPVLEHYLAGIQYALGELPADATPIKVAMLSGDGEIRIVER